MPRGGYREGAGGKPTWRHGKTKVIRVPEALADKIIDYARKIDSVGFDPVDPGIASVTESKIIDLSGVPTYSFAKGTVVYLADLVSFGYRLKPDLLHKSVSEKPRTKDQARVNALKEDVNELIKGLNLENE